MDINEQKIVEGLRLVAKRYGGGGESVGAVVKAVDSDAYTCDVLTDDEVMIPAVMYKSVTEGDIDITKEPALESRVFINKLEDSDQYFIVVFGKVAKVIIAVGNYQFKIDSNGIAFNDGNLGGLVKLDAVVGKLNALENDLNSIKNIFSTWTPVPNDGGAALKTASTAWSGQTITTTVNADLENTNVKQ